MSQVTLLVYDLSQGMARAMSMGMVGKQIDGIWHTAVVVYGREYCFGQGIQEFQPANSPYGRPVQRIDMGTTQIPPEVFQEYMDTMRTVWTADKPFGQSIRPMIESMYGRSSHAVTETSNIATSQNSPAVIHCTNLAALRDLIKNNKAVAIDFTSQTCGPCRVISPEFDRLIGEANANGTKVVGVSVETPVARDISAEFQIYATPTFMFYHNGEKMSEFKGADRAELKSSIDLLVYTAYPPHPHKKHPFRAINELVMAPAINFVVSSNLDVIFKKLNEIVAENKVGFDTDALETLQNWMKATDYRKNTILPHNWHVVPSKLLLALPVAKLFPLLDILRLLVLNSTIRNYFVEGDKDFVYVQLIIRVLSDDNAGMATKLMLSKFICNLFDPTDHKQSLKLLSTKRVHESSSRDEITRLLVETLLAPEYQLRQASALLAYNIGWSQAQIRQSPAPFDEAWWSELIAAISNAIETESTSEKANDETAFRLIGAIALLLVYSEDPVLELAQVVEVPLHIKHLTSKAHKEHGNWIKKLASEIDDLL